MSEPPSHLFETRARSCDYCGTTFEIGKDVISWKCLKCGKHNPRKRTMTILNP